MILLEYNKIDEIGQVKIEDFVAAILLFLGKYRQYCCPLHCIFAWAQVYLYQKQPEAM